MNWLISQLPWIGSLALVHLRLSVVPVVIGFLISVPLGLLANRLRRLRGAFLALIGVIYAIPSLPLLVALPSLIDTKILDPINLEIALCLYAIALMTRSCADALRQVDPQAIGAAQAIGMSPARLLFTVRLPLAGPVMLAGLRVVMSSTVSLVTVGSLIGVSSLGTLFTEGYQRAFVLEILTGVVATLLVALILDGLLVGLGKLAMPWTRIKSGKAAETAETEKTATEKEMA
jgi:osmoprotectant transport system permease protein